MADLLRSLGSGLSRTLVAPVRQGTFALRDVSAAAVAVAIVTAVVFTGLLIAVVAAPAIRTATTLISAPTPDQVMAIPAFLIPALLAALAFAFALLLVGALRCRALVCVLVAVGVLIVVTVLVAAGGSSTLNSSPPWAGYALIAITAAAVAVLRWRRSSVLRDTVVLLVLLLAIGFVCQRDFTVIATESGVRVDIAALALVLSFVTTLALPLSVASGLGAVDASLGVVLGLARGIAGAALAVIVLLWQGWIIATSAWSAERMAGLVAGAGVLAVCVALWFASGVGRRARGGESDDTTAVDTADDARDQAGRWSLPVSYGLASAVILGGGIGLVGLGIHLATGLSADAAVSGVIDPLLGLPGITLARIGVLVFLVVMGVVLRRRGRALAAAMAWIDAVLIASYSLSATEVTAAWWHATPDSLADIGVIALVVGAVIALVRSPRAWMSLATPVLVIACVLALLRRADVLSAPITLLAGGSVTAVLVVGLAWSLLTDSGAHGNSPGLPREGRLLLTLGNFTFTAAVVAWAVLGLQAQPYDDLQAATALGVQTLGSALLIVVALVTARTGHTGAGIPVPPTVGP